MTDNKLPLSLADAHALMDRVIAEYGADVQYGERFNEVTGLTWKVDESVCQNFRIIDGKVTPLCAIGAAVHLAIPAEVWDAQDWEQTYSGAERYVPQFFDVESWESPVAFLTSIQSNQDRGLTWGEAVTAAKEEYRIS